MGELMRKSLLAITAAVVVIGSSSAAYSGNGPYVFGDSPYRLDFGPDPRVESGCLKWNWQEYQWNDFCAAYVHPKAYMHPRSRRSVVQVRG
jgi:hypothetical protein